MDEALAALAFPGVVAVYCGILCSIDWYIAAFLAADAAARLAAALLSNEVAAGGWGLYCQAARACLYAGDPGKLLLLDRIGRVALNVDAALNAVILALLALAAALSGRRHWRIHVGVVTAITVAGMVLLSHITPRAVVEGIVDLSNGVAILFNADYRGGMVYVPASLGLGVWDYIRATAVAAMSAVGALSGWFLNSLNQEEPTRCGDVHEDC